MLLKQKQNLKEVLTMRRTAKIFDVKVTYGTGWDEKTEVYQTLGASVNSVQMAERRKWQGKGEEEFRNCRVAVRQVGYARFEMDEETFMKYATRTDISEEEFALCDVNANEQ